MVLLMHSGVFIGSCDVIGMEFPKEEVGFVTLGSWVMSIVILTSVKMVCVCGGEDRKKQCYI